MSEPLVACRACGRQVAIDATRCPQCGKPYPGKQIGGVLKWIIVAVLSIAVIAVLSSCRDQSPDSATGVYELQMIAGATLPADIGNGATLHEELLLLRANHTFHWHQEWTDATQSGMQSGDVPGGTWSQDGSSVVLNADGAPIFALLEGDGTLTLGTRVYQRR